MGVCKTSNFSIFTFINDRDLTFCTRSYSSCEYHMMKCKGSNGKVCKMMMSPFGTLLRIDVLSKFSQNYLMSHSNNFVKTSKTQLVKLILRSFIWPCNCNNLFIIQREK